jgi:hypothetical protein
VCVEHTTDKIIKRNEVRKLHIMDILNVTVIIAEFKKMSANAIFVKTSIYNITFSYACQFVGSSAAYKRAMI